MKQIALLGLAWRHRHRLLRWVPFLVGALPRAIAGNRGSLLTELRLLALLDQDGRFPHVRVDVADRTAHFSGLVFSDDDIAALGAQPPGSDSAPRSTASASVAEHARDRPAALSARPPSSSRRASGMVVLLLLAGGSASCDGENEASPGTTSTQPSVTTTIGITTTSATPDSASTEPPGTTSAEPTTTAAPRSTSTQPGTTTAEPTTTAAPIGGDPGPGCVSGWVTPARGDPLRTQPLDIIRAQMGVTGQFEVVEMRYFTGPEVPWILAPRPEVVHRWYVKARLADDPSFRARWLVEKRSADVEGIAAIAPFDSKGYQSPDWRSFLGDSDQPRPVEGVPGTWFGIEYDFVTGEAGDKPGLPDEVLRCLEGT